MLLECSHPDIKETFPLEVFASEKILENCSQYLKPKDLIGIKGYTITEWITLDGYPDKLLKTKVIATKVSFLSSQAKEAMRDVESD
jgi:single-stranded DNA-binding protein